MIIIDAFKFFKKEITFIAIIIALGIFLCSYGLQEKNKAASEPPAPQACIEITPPLQEINQATPEAAPMALDIAALSLCEAKAVKLAKENADILTMNRNLAARLKEQYARLPDTRAWAQLCLPDEYDCLLQK